jgi:hypothetical protein
VRLVNSLQSSRVASSTINSLQGVFSMKRLYDYAQELHGPITRLSIV